MNDACERDCDRCPFVLSRRNEIIMAKILSSEYDGSAAINVEAKKTANRITMLASRTIEIANREITAAQSKCHEPDIQESPDASAVTVRCTSTYPGAYGVAGY
jgi:hypothetical protein